MGKLESLKPRFLNHVMDLVREAGIDVSDWANLKGGIKNAKSNPKYCYNWAFCGTDVVVLNIWYNSIKENSEQISLSDNLRETSRSESTKGIWKDRAKKFDEAVRAAFLNKMIVRVIINEGQKRNGDSKDTEASEVKFRHLDSLAWVVSSYNDSSGQFTLSRGIPYPKTADQFDLDPHGQALAEKKPVSGEAFVRNAEVRRLVLNRAKGKCEYCEQTGFQTNSGTLFLETHHIIPLSEKGDDAIYNVAALCPNHHREAHHGMNAKTIRSTLTQRVTNSQSTET